jgi:hypothetical protein
MLKLLRFLLAEKFASLCPSREGNGCGKRFVRFLKENLLWVRAFRTVEEMTRHFINFQCIYNEDSIIPAAIKPRLRSDMNNFRPGLDC